MKQYRIAPTKVGRAMTSMAAVAVASLLFAGCGGDGGGGGGAAGQQKLTYGLSGEPQEIKAGQDQGTVNFTLDALVHAGLVRYDAKGELKPDLAADFKKVDPKTYTFTLQKGAKFSDGTPITSETVQKTLKYYADPANGARMLPAASNIKNFEVKDDSNFVIHLATNDSDFLQYLADPSGFIAKDDALVPGAVAKIGAGPFIVTSAVDGSSMKLKKNPGFWDAANVKLDEIDLVYYVDAGQRTNALLSGDADLIDYVAWPDFDRVKSTKGLVLDAKAGSYINLEFNASKGPFADPRVRQAVGYAVDRDAVVKTAFSGHAKPTYGVPLDESSPFASELSKNMLKYDPEKAKQLLAQAGYAGGFKATILSTNSQQFYQDTAQVVQANLAKVGIKLTIDAPDWPTRNEKSAAGNYGIRISGGGGLVTSPAYLGAWLATNNHSYGYKNTDLVKALDAGRTAETEDAAKQAYDKAFQIFAEDTPAVYLAAREQGFAYKDKVKGYATLPGFLSLYSGQTVPYISISEG